MVDRPPRPVVAWILASIVRGVGQNGRRPCSWSFSCSALRNWSVCSRDSRAVLSEYLRQPVGLIERGGVSEFIDNRPGELPRVLSSASRTLTRFKQVFLAPKWQHCLPLAPSQRNRTGGDRYIQVMVAVPEGGDHCDRAAREQSLHKGAGLDVLQLQHDQWWVASGSRSVIELPAPSFLQIPVRLRSAPSTTADDISTGPRSRRVRCTRSRKRICDALRRSGPCNTSTLRRL